MIAGLTLYIFSDPDNIFVSVTANIGLIALVVPNTVGKILRKNLVKYGDD